MEKPVAEVAPPTGGLRASYDREAAYYDARRYKSSEGRFFSDLETKVVLSWLALSPAAKVLDVPAGTGRLSVALADTGATAIGVDISANMLGVARAKSANGASRVRFAQGSGAALPFADDTFDGVVSFKFFHLIPNDQKRQFIVDMARVLKPGRPLVVEFNSPYYGIVLAWLRYTFRKKHSGGMRMKCLFPDQVLPLFEGLEVTRTQGVKLPFSGALARLFGSSAIDRLNLWFGSLPGLKYLSYAIIVEARKPSTHG
jgi:ubiquinone/menaquinone biosynthesis C-methylase UbiE